MTRFLRLGTRGRLRVGVSVLLAGMLVMATGACGDTSGGSITPEPVAAALAESPTATTTQPTATTVAPTTEAPTTVPPTTVAPTTVPTATPTTTAPTTSAPTTLPPTTTTTEPAVPGPSAADSLADFFAAAEALDAEIAAAAREFNAGFDRETGTVSTAALEAVASLGRPLAVHIPPGLPTDLETAVLAVYADLQSRAAALEGATSGVEEFGKMLDVDSSMMCLGLGSESKARFAGDLAAARALADQSPPPTATADSVAAGVLAVRIDAIGLINYGCENCGGAAYDEPLLVDWERGTIDDRVEFEATFVGSSWEIVIHAC